VDSDTTIINNVTGDSSILVKGYSNAKCTCSGITVTTGAGISSVKVNGITMTESSGTYTYTISDTVTNVYTIKVTDSRGYVSSKTYSFDSNHFINYISLTQNLTAVRPAPTSSYGTLTVSGNYFNGYFNPSSST
jgi:hypothetical protein